MKLLWQIMSEITQQELLYYSVSYKIRNDFLTFPASVPNVTFVPFNENFYFIVLIIMLNSIIYAYNIQYLA